MANKTKDNSYKWTTYTLDDFKALSDPNDTKTSSQKDMGTVYKERGATVNNDTVVGNMWDAISGKSSVNSNNVHSAVAEATGAINKGAGLADAVNATTGKSGNKSINGAPDELTEKVNSTFSQSDKVTSADSKREQGLGTLADLSGQKSILMDGIMAGLEREFVVPSEVTQADAYLSQQLKKIQSGKTSYTDQVKEMMGKIMGRDKFSYDVDTDPLFQQALSSAMNSGNQAMQDTIGQASALTGGYGSTYATTAGNQAYNSYIEDAYDNLPQYYQMALDAYQAEGDEMYRQFDMLSGLDEQEYNRNITAYDATFQRRNQIYDEAYTQFRDHKSDLATMANLQLNEYGQRVNAASSYYNATADYADSLYSREYNSWIDSVNNAMEMIKMYNTDYWSQKNFDEGVRQYEKTFAEDQRQFDMGYEQDEGFHEDDMTYNYDVLEHQSSEDALDREHQSSENALDREHTSSENELDREHQSSENALDREHQSSENQKDRDLTVSENEKDRAHDSAENDKAMAHDSAENALDRTHDSAENDKAMAHESSENALDREHDSAEGALDRAARVSSGGSSGGGSGGDYGLTGVVDEVDAAKAMEKAANSQPVKDFMASIYRESGLSRRGWKAEINGKTIQFDNYEQYVIAKADEWLSKGQLSEHQHAYLMARDWSDYMVDVR